MLLEESEFVGFQKMVLKVVTLCSGEEFISGLCDVTNSQKVGQKGPKFLPHFLG